MSFFEKLRRTWVNMSTNRKVKTVLHVVCDIGAGILASKVSAYYTKDEPKIIQKIVNFTSFGLGSALSNVAYDEFGDIVDVIIQEPKKEAEEDESNA